MLIEQDKIKEAKSRIAEETPDMIAEMLHVEKWDAHNKRGCCPFHSEDTPSFIWDKKRNSFHCFGCSRNVDIIDAFMETGLTYMQSVQKLFETAHIKYAFGELGVKSDHGYKYPHLEDCGNKETVYQYLNLRGISNATKDNEGNICFNYYNSSDVLTMVKKRPSRKVHHGETKTWCQPGSDTSPVLFNMNKVNISSPLVICEGEIDCLALIESGITNACSIPLGAGNTHWIEYNWDWLEQFENIVICFDNDEAGVKARKEVVPRLGTWRTQYVEIPKQYILDDGRLMDIKDINEVLYYCGRDEVINLVAHPEDPGVPSVVNVSEIQDVDLDEMEGVTTGIRELDTEIMKLFYGTLTIVSGLPGAGKTSFLSQLLCQALEQNIPAWMFSREMPGWMEKSWLNYIMAGGHHVKAYADSNGAKYYKVTPEAKQKISNCYNKMWFLYRDDWSNKLDDVMRSMEDCVRKFGAKLLIIDNLMTLDLDSDENSALLKQTECINKLIKFAMKYSVAIVLVAHPRKMPKGEDVGIYDISGTSNIINLAHRSIGLRRIDKEREKSSYDVCLTLIKDRMRGRAGKKVNLYYDVPTRRFYTNETEYDYQYGWDDGTYPPLPYPHANENEVFGSC